ncbi:hypothetical protein OUZ56_026637 [Daphnia magna]|uniref:Uncharacterized protein n=1 Tax=Daphnia magna TaxID=35525 RepID=A0ABQ9ZMC4_9CRUS|nr:hypothetical protein OUZ56_026637 [Daphnia magna]
MSTLLRSKGMGQAYPLAARFSVKGCREQPLFIWLAACGMVHDRFPRYTVEIDPFHDNKLLPFWAGLAIPRSFSTIYRGPRASIKCGRGPRTADRRNCGLSPADWPKIFDSSPQFLHRVAVPSPRIIRGYSIPYRHVYAMIWAWSPQIPVRILSCPVRTFNRSMFETVRILSLSPRKICQKILGQSAGESPQFLLSASAFYPGPFGARHSGGN